MRRTTFNDGWATRPKSNFFAEIAGAADPLQPVTLPHDSTLGQPRNAEHGFMTGYFPGGVYEYVKTFAVPAEYRTKRVALDFEGVYRTAMVYVNGSLAGHWAYGYSGFTVPLDNYLRYGADNEVRVEARSHRDSRWYSGAGIHRNVHLVVGELLHIALDGVRVTTPDVEADRAVVEVATVVENDSPNPRTVDVVTEIRDDNDQVVASDTGRITVLPQEPATVRQRLYVRDPTLWSPDTPALHTTAVSLLDAGAVVDNDLVTFGIRTLQLDPQQGLRINGQPIKLRGGCLHHDNGVLGSAAFSRADERRVELLKAAGFNALRSAHNPMSRAMLDACDRIGVLVMDEAFDMWTENKSDFDYALDFSEWWERDIESMVRKDHNHPSVIFYSIGNEIPELGSTHGSVWARRLAEKIRSLDETRFVTNGVNGMLAVMDALLARVREESDREGGGINTIMTGMADSMNQIGSSELVTERTAESFGVLDVAGMNYLEARYELDKELFPNRIIVGTETFPTRIDQLWRLVQDHSHVLGDFTWTAWDYLGEAGVGRVEDAAAPTAGQFSGPYPWITGWVGDLDITGHRRPASYYREIVFGLRHEPYVAVQRPERSGQTTVSTPWAWTDAIASWTWDGADGRPLTVEVYSDADEVELLLNGQSIGTAATGPANRFRAQFEVAYAPGELTAVARSGGQESGRTSLRTATGPIGLSVVPDRAVIRADQADLAYVEVTLRDAAGTVFTGRDREVTIAVEGPGVLQGFGSAVPVTEESYTDPVHTTFDGRALAVVRPTGAGVIEVTATAADCPDATVRVEAR